jgi:hypothetical protein
MRVCLFDLGFFVGDVLASDGIEFHDLHLLGLGALVLGGRVEMAGAGRGLELDLVTHGALLLEEGGLDGLTGGAQVGQHHFDALLVDQAQGGVGQAQTHPAVFAFNPEPARLQIGQEATFRLVVGV